MNEYEFWKLIENTRRGASHESCEVQVRSIRFQLSLSSPEEIVDFDRILWHRQCEANRWDLRAAARLINGPGASENFDAFVGWLVAQGETVFRKAILDPQSLADLVEATRRDYTCEALLDVARDAYHDATGEDMPDPTRRCSSIMGQPVVEEALPGKYPRLAAMHA